MSSFLKRLSNGFSSAHKPSSNSSSTSVKASGAVDTSVAMPESEDNLQVATFAMSWFWFPEAQFGCAPGVVKTKVGFTGGDKKNPTYHSLGDHTEAVLVTYDPTMTNYSELLDIFWNNHSSTSSLSRQYMSAIWYHNDEQKKLAEESKADRQKKEKKPIKTVIAVSDTFYEAEDYHQKYMLRKHHDIIQALKIKTNADLVNSVSAARLNGYLGGYGNAQELEREWSSFNLDDSFKPMIMRQCKNGVGGSCSMR